MPIYEYRCQQCRRKVTLYLATFSQPIPGCPHCGNGTLQRLFSTFSMRKTDQAIYDDILNDSRLTRGMLNDDPAALAEWNKRMTRGEKAAPEYEDMLGKMERGEPPPEPGSKSEETKESD